jgi:hypothetical protein
VLLVAVAVAALENEQIRRDLLPFFEIEIIYSEKGEKLKERI